MNYNINNYNNYINTIYDVTAKGCDVVFGAPVEYIHEPTGYMEPIEVVSYLNDMLS